MKQAKPIPTAVPINSAGGQRELRQCDCCGKLQAVSEGFDLKQELCRQCVEGFQENLEERLG